MRVLLVEDDADLGRSIVSGLRAEGIDTAGASTCAAARESLLFAAHGVIVLDVMLPDDYLTKPFAFAELVARIRWDPLLRPSPGEGGRLTVDEWAPIEGRSANLGLRVRL